jgi:hypothetical protein
VDVDVLEIDEDTVGWGPGVRSLGYCHEHMLYLSTAKLEKIPTTHTVAQDGSIFQSRYLDKQVWL